MSLVLSLYFIIFFLKPSPCRYELCSTGDKVIHSGAVHNSSQTGDSVHEKIQNHSSYTQNGDKIATDRENIVDVFRWSRCKKAMPEQIMRSIGIPLPMEHLEVTSFVQFFYRLMNAAYIANF